MGAKVEEEWKKGSAELLVLSLLEDLPRHGYEIANGRVAMLENEEREREKIKLSAAEAERARSTHLFDVSDASRTAGTLTVAPGPHVKPL